MTKKCGSILLAIVLVLTLLPWGALANDSPFAGGDGSAENPYQVQTAAQLNKVREHLSSHFIQTADIELGEAPWNQKEGWEPIGSSTTGNRFTGSFDGGGYAIRGLTIDRSSSYQGLFGYTEKAVLRNIRLEGAQLQAGSDTGGLMGYCSGSIIENVSADVQIVSTSDRIGGLVGFFYGGEIRTCYSSGSVQGRQNVGGLVGYSTVGSGIITDTYSRASVSGSSNVGGFLGRLFNGYVFRSYSTGRVTGTGSSIGGFLGIRTAGSVHHCYWDTETSGQETSAGGDGVAGRTTAQMQQRETYREYNFYNLWEIDEGNDYPVFRDLSAFQLPRAVELTELDGSGTVEDPYLITDKHQLNAARQDLAAHYRLANHIDLSDSVIWNYGRGWQPIGSDGNRFTGSFDGAGYVIRGLTINRPTIEYQGLFGYMENAVLRNIRLEDAHLQTRGNSGGLAGRCSGSIIENVSADVQILSTLDRIGGLVGWFGGEEIRTCYSSGSVQGREYVGGLVGWSSSTGSQFITDSYSRASVSGSSGVGGLLGRLWNGRILRSYSTGHVTGTGSSIGGFLGIGPDGSVSDCYWDTETSGRGTSAGGDGVAGRTTAQMQQQGTFEDWDFTTVWSIVENKTYPFLQWQTYTVTYGVKEGDGMLTASVDGVPIISGAAVLEGSTVIFTAIPDSNSWVEGWFLDGTLVSNGLPGTSYLISELLANVNVQVAFNELFATGSINHVVLEVGEDRVIFTIGAYGSALAAGAGTGLYDYMASGGVPVVWAVRSGNKFIGIEAYGTAFTQEGNTADAIAAAPAQDQATISGYLIFEGFDGEGNPILTPLYP